MFCQQCGSPMKEGQAFCGKCGAAAPDLSSVAETVTPITPEITVPEGDAFSAPIPEEAPQAKKRVWPKIVIPIVSLVLVATLAVGAYFTFFTISEEDVIGKWAFEADGATMTAFNRLTINETDDNLWNGLENEKLTMYLEFYDDNTMSISFDSEQMIHLAKKMVVIQYGMSFEEFLRKYNATEEQFTQSMENSIETMKEKLTTDWSLEDGKVYVSDKSDRWIEVDGDTMQFHYDEDREWAENASQEEMDAVEILVFTRVDD